MMRIKDNLESVRQRMQDAERRSHRQTNSTRLIAVSKKHGLDKIRSASILGVEDFGENRAAELAAKCSDLEENPLDKEVRWHMIGHLQSNKVRSIIDVVDVVHSVDRKSLAKEIQKRAEEVDRTIDILLQVNISGETQKHGLSSEELPALLDYCEARNRLNVVGLMGMASFIDDETVLRRQFSTLRDLREKYLHGTAELCMGMSNDYEIAIEEGATMIRVGTAIFGNRVY